MTKEKLIKREVYPSNFYDGVNAVYVGDVFWKDPAVMLRNPESNELELYRFTNYSIKEGTLSPENPEKIKYPHKLIMNKLERIAKDKGI